MLSNLWSWKEGGEKDLDDRTASTGSQTNDDELAIHLLTQFPAYGTNAANKNVEWLQDSDDDDDNDEEDDVTKQSSSQKSLPTRVTLAGTTSVASSTAGDGGSLASSATAAAATPATPIPSSGKMDWDVQEQSLWRASSSAMTTSSSSSSIPNQKSTTVSRSSPSRSSSSSLLLRPRTSVQQQSLANNSNGTARDYSCSVVDLPNNLVCQGTRVATLVGSSHDDDHVVVHSCCR